jgi:hypothetical protein
LLVRSEGQGAPQIQGESSSEDEEESLGGLVGICF